MRSPFPADREGRAERGSVTAEFAAVLPAVLLVLAAGLMCLSIAGQQLRLQDAVADAARMIGRGDAAAAPGRVARAVPGASVTTSQSGDLVCATARAGAGAGAVLALGIRISASACTLDDR